MQIEINGKLYDVYITRKNNKNMYLRVKEDGIYIKALVKNTYVKEFSLYEIKDEYVS